MEANLKGILAEKEVSAEHGKLLQTLNNLTDGSRKRMADYYPMWDRHDDIYRCLKPEGQDKQDKKAEERKEPQKMVVPIAHAQVQTFVAFCYAVFFQREYFFEITPMGADASRAADIAEVLIQRDLNHFNFPGVVYQFLLDIARFGLGVTKESWVSETKYVTTTSAPTQFSALGFTISYGGGKVSKQRVPAYQGNKVISVSPYRFFPDPSLPINRFQEGEFVATEDEFTYSALKQMEADGVCAGVDYIPNINEKNALPGRKFSRLQSVRFIKDGNASLLASESSSPVIVTEVVWNCIPSQTFMGPGETIPLGTETWPCKYLFWIANDARIIRADKFDHDHDEFPVSATQFSPDMHHFINDGLSGTIDSLQEVISWFVNSHITSVRKVIQNFLLVDPQAIYYEDLQERRSVIRTKPGMNRLGLDKIIMQLNVNDVTQNHMDDARTLEQLVQMVTGISDNALGQFYTGRRSATEAKNANTGTASRLKMHAALIYYGGILPTGRRMLSNLRQGLTMKTYVKIFGILQDPKMEGYMQFALVDKADLQGDLDFEILDGTLPSEKQYQAQTIQELLASLITAPQLIMMTGLDVKKLIFEQLRLRGIHHPERFMMDQAQMMMVQQAMLAQQQPQGPQNGEPTDQNQPVNAIPLNGQGGAAAGA